MDAEDVAALGLPRGDSKDLEVMRLALAGGGVKTCSICFEDSDVGVECSERHFHCETCQACYTLDSKASHKCVERALESDCPVCMQYLFTSSEALFVGPQVQRAHFQLRF